MSTSMNVVILGNVCNDPQIKVIGENTVANFNIAVNRTINGNKETIYFRAGCWNALATVANQYVKKGDPIQVTVDWMKLGVYKDQPTVDVQVNKLTLLGNGHNNGEHSSDEDSRDIPF